MREALYNQRFNDIYFSPEDGLAETEYTFLRGNNLPDRWLDGKGAGFTIAETGFGTGLNFLAAWKLFDETANPGQILDYISFELYPLHKDEIAQALARWRAELGPYLDRLLSLYPLRVPGFHRLQIAENIRVTLVFGDVLEGLAQLKAPCGVDAWFLDGFAPARNPQMWAPELYREMCRLSNKGASAATFTAAGHVRRGLAEAGFEVAKQPGFGRKRDMTVARLSGGTAKRAENRPKRIAIIGGGLAGSACAGLLHRQGSEPVIFEKAEKLAAGASGNRLGLYNPRFYARRTAESAFYTASYAQAVRTMRGLSATHDIELSLCGALHLLNSADKEKRLRSLEEHGGWHHHHLRLLSVAEASETAGIKLADEALYLPESGSVCPEKLCHAYAQGVDVRLNTAVDALDSGCVNGENFDAVIVANAVAAQRFALLSWLPVHTVRGQISTVKTGAISARLKTNICYGGYISAAHDNRHITGSTFQKWLDDTSVKDEDHRDNLDKLEKAIPVLKDDLTVCGGRAALRTAAQDHFPILGAAADQTGKAVAGVYLSLAHGSHGIISTLAGAHLVSDMIQGAPLSMPGETVSALDAVRFIKRADRKKKI